MKSRDLLAKLDRKPDVLERKAKKALLNNRLTLVELADRLNCPPKLALEAVERLESKGVKLNLEADTLEIRRSVPPGGQLVVDSRNLIKGKWHTFGLVADTHLYSKYARLDVLQCLYDVFAREGIRKVFHGGNAIDGEFRFNKHDLVGRAGMGPQLEYFAQEYPQRKGMVTHFLTADDHEGWYNQREGINVGELMQSAAEDVGRKDLRWIGHIEADVRLRARRGEAWMRVMHPGGGTAYAISYIPQKIVESYQGGEKPQILIVNHLHKFDYGYPREVHTILPGCVEDQTPFMRKMKIQAMVGGCIMRFHQAPTGEINRLQVQWMPFYDRGFYEKHDRYRRW